MESHPWRLAREIFGTSSSYYSRVGDSRDSGCSHQQELSLLEWNYTSALVRERYSFKDFRCPDFTLSPGPDLAGFTFAFSLRRGAFVLFLFRGLGLYINFGRYLNFVICLWMRSKRTYKIVETEIIILNYYYDIEFLLLYWIITIILNSDNYTELCTIINLAAGFLT